MAKELDGLKKLALLAERRLGERLERLGEEPDLLNGKEMREITSSLIDLGRFERDIFEKPNQPERARQKVARAKAAGDAPKGAVIEVRGIDGLSEAE